MTSIFAAAAAQQIGLPPYVLGAVVRLADRPTRDVLVEPGASPHDTTARAFGAGWWRPASWTARSVARVAVQRHAVEQPLP